MTRLINWISDRLNPLIKRPLWGFCLFMIIGILLGFYRAVIPLILVCIIFFLLFLWRIRRRLCPPAFILLTLGIFIGYFLIHQAFSLSNYTSTLEQRNIECQAQAQGTVYRIRNFSDYQMLYLSKVKVKVKTDLNNLPSNTWQNTENIVVTLSEDKLKEVQIGDEIQVYGKASAYAPTTNPGQFDKRLYYHSINIGTRIRANTITILKPSQDSFSIWLSTIHQHIEDTIYQITEEKYASVLSAILLGNRDALDEEMSDLFSMSGIGHILAISGLHISMIGMGLYRILRRLGLLSYAAMLIGSFFIMLYGVFTGNSVSTIRALIMFIVTIVSQVVGRSYDILSGASLAAVLILFQSPLYLFQSGFLLSFGAVLGVAIIVPYFQHIFPTHNKILCAFYGSFGISVMTLPITLYFYYQFPIYAVLLNMLILPLMSLVMSFGIGGVIGGLMNIALGRFVIGAAVGLIKLYEGFCNISLSLPCSNVVTGRPSWLQILFYYSLVFLTLYFTKKRLGKKFYLQSLHKLNIKNVSLRELTVEYMKNITKSIHVFLLLGVAFVGLIWNFHKGFTVEFIDVGQGDGIYIRTDENISIMIDGGSSSDQRLYQNILKGFLQAQGVVQIDSWIMSHADSDHISGMVDLMKAQVIQVKDCYLPKLQNPDEAMISVIRSIKEAGATLHFLSRGSEIDYGSVQFQCLWPTEEVVYEDRNCGSLSLLMKYQDFSFLFTGDLCKDEEPAIVEAVRACGVTKVDVYKAAHHGSKGSNSSTLLEGISPACIVISCGRNNDYGHPHRDALQRMEACGSVIYRTDQQGAIIINSDGKRLLFSSWLC